MSEASSTQRVHVVTGATGLLGGALCIRLLMTNAGTRILCPLRPGETSPRSRLMRHLAQCADSYGTKWLKAAVPWRTDAFAWDMDDPVPMIFKGIDTVWHFAAARGNRTDEQAHQRHLTVLAGLLDDAARANVREFVYASTAYIGSPPRNAYEAAKKAGEDMVLKENRLRGRVVRPAVVMGHSSTYAAHASVYSGLYALAGRGRCVGEPVVPYGWQINVVPVDVAVRQAMTGTQPVTWLTAATTVSAAAAADTAADPLAPYRDCKTVRQELLAACPFLAAQDAIPRGDGPVIGIGSIRGWSAWYQREVLGLAPGGGEIVPPRGVDDVPVQDFL